MLDKVKELIGEVNAFNTTAKDEIETFRIKFLSKKGLLNDLFDEFKNVAPAERKEFGQALNTLKNLAQDKVNELKDILENSSEQKGFYGDLTRPEEPIELGSRHPISLVRNKIIDVFSRIGFTVSEGPEIEDDWHNFTALNLPEYHPARDMQDTFFIETNPDILLRTIHRLFKCVIWKIINRQLEQFLREEFLETRIFQHVHIVFFTRLKVCILILMSLLPI